MKLFKVISSSGELSRRKSIDAIKEAMVTVNGRLELDPFMNVHEKDDIRLDDKKIKELSEYSNRKEEILIDLNEERIIFGNNKFDFKIENLYENALEQMAV